LKVDEEYSSLLPPLSQPESEALKRSIREDGQHFPIIANKHGTVLDGHNRLKVCRELGTKPRFAIRDFYNDRLREKKFVIVSNLRRRHLNDFRRSSSRSRCWTCNASSPCKERFVQEDCSGGEGRVGYCQMAVTNPKERLWRT
jgi:hypothetical protein